VAIVALPLAMALGIASGASPEKGLVTAVIAGFLISALGGSRVQIGGPTGAFVVVIFNVIARHGYDGLLLATLLAGLMLIVAGYARLGQVIKFIPHPVITGFTAGIAVIIASSQVKDFLGLQTGKVSADFLLQWGCVLAGARQRSTWCIADGWRCRRFCHDRAGAPSCAAPAGVSARRRRCFAGCDPCWACRWRRSARVFRTSRPACRCPRCRNSRWRKLRLVLPSAFTIAFLAGIEALLSAVVADGMTGTRHRSNQELVGQGVANVASALFGGLPATGAIARTATNIKAGGLTPVAGMLHAAFVLLFMLFAADLMAYVPMAALAAILFVVAWGMSEHERFIALLRMPNGDRGVSAADLRADRVCRPDGGHRCGRHHRIAAVHDAHERVGADRGYPAGCSGWRARHRRPAAA
jgi:SulP family sulfate permease